MTRPDALALRAQATELRQQARTKRIQWRAIGQQATRLLDEGAALREQERALLARADECERTATVAEQADRWERAA